MKSSFNHPMYQPVIGESKVAFAARLMRLLDAYRSFPRRTGCSHSPGQLVIMDKLAIRLAAVRAELKEVSSHG